MTTINEKRRAKERFLQKFNDSIYTEENNHTVTDNDRQVRSKKKKFAILREHQDDIIVKSRTRVSRPKSKPYRGQRITQPPKTLTTRIGQTIHIGRSIKCQNFIDEITELSNYGYSFLSFMENNPIDYESKLAVIYEFYAKHNETYYSNHILWLCAHADIMFTYFQSFFHKTDLLLLKFIQRCYYIRTHNALDVYRKYGPAFIPKGYVKVEDEKLAFFHLVPLNHLKQAQDSYLERHYKTREPKALKHSYANPPDFEIKLHMRTITSGKSKTNAALKLAQSKKVTKSFVVDASITHPKERIDALRKLLKNKKREAQGIAQEISSSPLLAMSRAFTAERVMKQKEVVQENVNVHQPRLSKKQQKQNRAKHRRDKESAHDMTSPPYTNRASAVSASATTLNGNNGEVTNADDVSVEEYRIMVEELKARPDQQIYQLHTNLHFTLIKIITILDSSNEFVSRDGGNEDIGPLLRWSYKPKDHITQPEVGYQPREFIMRFSGYTGPVHGVKTVKDKNIISEAVSFLHRNDNVPSSVDRFRAINGTKSFKRGIVTDLLALNPHIFRFNGYSPDGSVIFNLTERFWGLNGSQGEVTGTDDLDRKPPTAELRDAAFVVRNSYRSLGYQEPDDVKMRKLSHDFVLAKRAKNFNRQWTPEERIIILSELDEMSKNKTIDFEGLTSFALGRI